MMTITLIGALLAAVLRRQTPDIGFAIVCCLGFYWFASQLSFYVGVSLWQITSNTVKQRSLAAATRAYPLILVSMVAATLLAVGIVTGNHICQFGVEEGVTLARWSWLLLPIGWLVAAYRRRPNQRA